MFRQYECVRAVCKTHRSEKSLTIVQWHKRIREIHLRQKVEKMYSRENHQNSFISSSTTTVSIQYHSGTKNVKKLRKLSMKVYTIQFIISKLNIMWIIHGLRVNKYWPLKRKTNTICAHVDKNTNTYYIASMKPISIDSISFIRTLLSLQKSVIWTNIT